MYVMRQVARLVTLIKVHKKAMGELLGSTTKCEHVIDVTGPPVKEGYYRVSPVTYRSGIT